MTAPLVTIGMPVHDVGAARNLSDLVLRARGRYLEWSAHDDWIEPELLSSCIDLLEHTPDGVLCWTGTVVVDASGGVLGGQRLRGDPGVRTGDCSGDWWDPLSPTHHPVTAFVLQAHECSRAVLAADIAATTKVSLLGRVAATYAVHVVRRVGWEIRDAGSDTATKDLSRVPDGSR